MGEAILTRRGGGKPKPPASWTFLQACTNNSSFVTQVNTWYKIHCYGPSGSGGNTTHAGSNSGGEGGGGGGAGGYACSMLFFSAVTSVPITISASITSFSNYLSATSGTQGSASMAGGSGGNASGGNIVNSPGTSGGSGGHSQPDGYAEAGQRGGNYGGNGGRGGKSGENNIEGGGGGGGARLPDSPYTAAAEVMAPYAGGRGWGWNIPPTNGITLPLWNFTTPVRVFGGGGGGGGANNRYPAYGAIGSAGIIIIEKGVR